MYVILCIKGLTITEGEGVYAGVVLVDLSDKEPHRQVGVGTVMTSVVLSGEMVGVVVCTDLSGKKPHRRGGVGNVMLSRILGGEMVGTLAWIECKICGFDSCFRQNISHFHHTHETGSVTRAESCKAMCCMSV